METSLLAVRCSDCMHTYIAYNLTPYSSPQYYNFSNVLIELLQLITFKKDPLLSMHFVVLCNLQSNLEVLVVEVKCPPYFQAFRSPPQKS